MAKFYGMSNDYMFKAVMQECEDVLRNLLGALLNLEESEIVRCKITNPIILGESIAGKDCILDIKLVLNGDRNINIELQMRKEIGWEERSLLYWAKIFKAKTLEELESLAGEQEVFKNMILELKKLTEDEKIKMEMEARADYESRIATAKGAGFREGQASRQAEIDELKALHAAELEKIRQEFEEYKKNH